MSGAVQVDYAQVWASLPRERRTRIMRIARRGARAIEKPDAVLTTWWASQQLARGPWPAVRLAAIILVVVIGLLAATGQLSFDQIFGNPILGIMVLVPFAAWPAQRRRLQNAVRANIGAVTAKIPETVPSKDEVAALLAKPKFSKLVRPKPSR